MYFSVVSSRSSQYAVFNHTQATQSADSIAQIIYRAIGNVGNQESTGGGVLLEKLKGLAIGESISTDADAFESMNPTSAGAQGKLDPEQLGAYSVIITRLEDAATGEPRYDLNVMSSVDGNRDSVHYIINYHEETLDNNNGEAGDMKLFTATGYLPNDAYINGGYYLTDVFYDTQFTYMNFYNGSGENRIGFNLYTGGDLAIGNDAMTAVHSATSNAIASADVSKIGPVTWGIRGTFLPEFGSDFGIRGGSRYIVGGDLKNYGNSFFYTKNDGYTGNEDVNKPIYIYVNGDFVSKNSSLTLKNIYLFVNGEVNCNFLLDNGSRVFVTDLSKAHGTCQNGVGHFEQWNWTNGTGQPGMSLAEAMAALDAETKTIAYPKWDLSPNIAVAGTQTLNIKLNANSYATTIDGQTLDAKQCTYLISYDNTTETATHIKTPSNPGGTENGAIGKNFIINSIKISGDNQTPRTIVIDTGDDPNNIITIQVKGNYGAGNKTFMWFPESIYDLNSYSGRNVILKGRGTVLVDIPKGITYQDNCTQYIMHYGWWSMIGGQETMENGHLVFKAGDVQAKESEHIVPYIHKLCGTANNADCDCQFSREDMDEECPLHPGTKMKKVICKRDGDEAKGHGQVATYCPSCEPEKNDSSKDSSANWCASHVDRKKMEAYYNTLSGTVKDRWTGKDGKIIYPTTNFFIVSCEESAEMRFAQAVGGESITFNRLFGFIYAPYIMYKASGGNNAGVIKLCGGMIVSDYDIMGVNSYMGCYPEMMPKQLAGIGGGVIVGNLGGAVKSWKLKLS